VNGWLVCTAGLMPAGVKSKLTNAEYHSDFSRSRIRLACIGSVFEREQKLTKQVNVLLSFQFARGQNAEKSPRTGTLASQVTVLQSACDIVL